MRSLYLTTRDHLNHSNKISWILYIRLLVLNWLTYSIWWLPEESWLDTSRWQCFHTTLFHTLNFSLFSFCLEFPLNFGPSFFFSVKSRDYNGYINDSTNYRRRISQQSNTKKVGTLPTNAVVCYIFARLLSLPAMFFIAVNSSTLGGREDSKVSQQFWLRL